jgi:hypothetical protein
MRAPRPARPARRAGRGCAGARQRALGGRARHGALSQRGALSRPRGGLALYVDDRLRGVIAVDATARHVHRVFIVVNPDKLRPS